MRALGHVHHKHFGKNGKTFVSNNYLKMFCIQNNNFPSVNQPYFACKKPLHPISS